jgi:ribosomal protein L20
VWSWSPGLIEQIDANKPVISSDGGALTRADKVRNRLNTKVEGVSYDIHGLTEGPVVDQFNEFWEYIEQLQEANSKINDSTLEFAIRELKRAQSALANLVTSIRTADQSYSNEWQAKTFQDWLESLQFQYRQLQEAEAAGMAGTYNNAIHLFDNLVEDWPEYENQTLDNGDQSPTKRDELYRLLTGCLDDGESVIVLLRKQSDQQAFRIDLQERGGPVYEALEDRVHLETPDSLIDAPSVDRFVLYGPPDWDQRWVFRSAHASNVTVLAYEHQLSLLGFQVRELNDTLEQLTSSDLHRAAITAAAEDEEDISSSTTARVDLDVPSPGSDDVSGSEISEGYEVIEEYEPTSVDDIIQSIQERTYTPDEGSKGQIRRESGPVSAIRFELEENWQLHKLPSGKARVVNSDKDGVIKKSAKNVQREDTIIKIRRSEILRNQLYEMIKKEEDHRTVFKAELWRHRLQEALDEAGDSLQQFIARLEDRGIDVDYSTFRDWYIGERRYTQNDEHMRIVAEEYGITGAIDNVEEIKEEARRLKTIYIQLIRALRSQAHKATEAEAPEDIVISKEYDIRLSDFDLFDETGEHLVKSLTVRGIERGVNVPRNHLNRLEKV